MKKIYESNQGITLIALIITIIVLLILAGVSISLVVGDNGVLTQSQNASKKTTVASEKEAIGFVMSDVQVDILTDKDVPESKLIGDKLSRFSAVEAWKSVMIGDKSYENGWYLIEKDDNIPSYGKAKSNWLINYNTGEIIELEDDSYRIASSNASGALVDNTLKLNIDPSNLQDRSKWENNGIKVSFVGEDTGGENSGVKETEIKFDGVDDYLKIEGVNVNESDGITYEFYLKGYNNELAFPLEKVYFNIDGSINLEKYSQFRTSLGKAGLRCCFGNGDSNSNLKEDGNSHWFCFSNVKKSSDYNYLSVTINFKSGEVKVFDKGNEIQNTTCSLEYLKNGDIFNQDLPFVVGLFASGNIPLVISYSRFDLYACRLYTRILSDEEINQNYTATTKYHNDLVNSVSE